MKRNDLNAKSTGTNFIANEEDFRQYELGSRKESEKVLLFKVFHKEEPLIESYLRKSDFT